MRQYFMTTDRIGFSHWSIDDLSLAEELWGNQNVTKFICASGCFSKDDIVNRLKREQSNQEQYGIQYWPIFDVATSAFIGCCGLRPLTDGEDSLEIGFHLCEHSWGKGYAKESAKAVIHYAFTTLGAKELFAGHHPQNEASKVLLTKLGFQFIGDHYYQPTRLYHPSYKLEHKM